jgi:hypothetical protein
MTKSLNLILATLLFTLVLSCKKSDEADPTPASASVIGKWNFASLGIKTDNKTIEATTAEIQKYDKDNQDLSLDDLLFTYEFVDKTKVISKSGTETKNGTYIIDNAKKTITITDNVNKNEVEVYEIVSLTNNEIVLGQLKSEKKGSDGLFIFTNEIEDFAFYLIADLIYTIKGIDGEAEITKAKSVQLTLRLKK